MSHIRVKANRYNYCVALFVCLGSFTYGFTSGIFGTVIGQTSWWNYFNLAMDSSYGAVILDLCNGLFYAGGFLGCLTVNWLSDTFGRRRAIQIIMTICIIAAVIQTSSVHVAMLIVGRCLGGIAADMINCTVPTYISEISPPSQRGRLVGFHGVWTLVAFGLVNWAGLGTYFKANPNIQWRLLFGLQLVAPLVLLAGSFKLPESPRWLISRGRDKEGLDILERLHENPADPLHCGAKDEFFQIKNQLAQDNEESLRNLFQLLRNKKYRSRLLTGFFLQAMTQTSGILIVELANLNVIGWKPLMITGFYNSWAAFLNVINSFTVDRVGRVRAGGILCVSIVAALVAHYGTPDNTNLAGAGAAIAFMFLFVTFYGSCVDASSYIFCSEIFPTHIRAQGVGMATSGVFLMNAVYLTAAGTAFTKIGWKFYLVFIIIPALALPIIWRFFPETKGLTPEEIGALFGDEPAVGTNHIQELSETSVDERIKV
ncbi:sugar transporter, putative [Talaromyces stipitatus ATCC 10500]|uniref:Sugar transporter, putative n=1 Tax=Talaromyces stipitatus (strain ATCC 10500 / CBS 375.48 / QM 6759 / NRRL 1006) TaxID=441959 RepID=B8LZ17_TALSN|nr:sugar transporter, putative [Talaromyces stipitatus ATCC 10500]EED21061.1 sugar transporter, putative [Talaromyces stipitatus ATCC 10500]